MDMATMVMYRSLLCAHGNQATHAHERVGREARVVDVHRAQRNRSGTHLLAGVVQQDAHEDTAGDADDARQGDGSGLQGASAQHTAS